jgi:hypothetical protein
MMAGLCAWFAAFAGGANLAHSAEDKSFTVEVTSSGNAAFSGECRVVTALGDEQVLLEGPVPFRRTMTGTRLNCTITQSDGDGTLSVEVRSSNGNVTRSRTQGRGSSVRLAMG